MLAELHKSLVEVAQKAAEPKKPIITPLEGHRHKKRFLMPDGKVETVDAELPLRKHTVNDIASLALWGPEDGGEVHIWHDDDGVTLILDDVGHRENTVRLPLPKHPKFEALAAASVFEQRGLIDFLRLNLKAEIAAACPDFIAKLRSVKITSDETGETNIQHGRESMGRQIMQQVAGAEDLPDELTLALPIWLHLNCQVTVDCAFDINCANGTFIFRPKPGVIEQCQCFAQKWLHEQLVEAFASSAVIYFGKP